jgi:hypothetical protein
MKVLYHNDMDGRCSAFLVGHFAKKRRSMFSGGWRNIPTPAKFIEMSYGKPMPFDQIEKDERVWIVDFSIEPEDMLKLLEITEDVHWIDHHITALRKYQDKEMMNLKGLRRVGEAGCALTFKYCCCLLGESIFGELPWFVRLIADRDVWVWAYGDRTKFFHLGFSAEDTSPTSKTWYDAWGSTEPFEKRGEIIEKMIRKQAQEVFDQYGFEVTFHGHKCFAVNSALIRSSEYFQELRPNYDMWIVFRFTGRFWTVSLYSCTVDTAAIAEQYVYEGKGGGGHALDKEDKGRGSASGFQCAFPPFLPFAEDYTRMVLSGAICLGVKK